MNGAQTVAWVALAYLTIPLAAYGIYVLVKRLRKTGKEDGDGDTDS